MMIRSRLGAMVALVALVLVGNVQADVALGISNSVPGGLAGSFANILTFDTTSLGGARVAGVGLYSLAAQTGSGTITFASSGDSSEDQIGTFSVDTGSALDGSNLMINWGNYSGYLTASRTYTVSISQLGQGYFANSGSYSVEPGISNYWQNPIAGDNGDTPSAAIQIYYDPTSVPEPGTLILTGSALAAGAVGAYIKRRRKTRTEAESTV